MYSAIERARTPEAPTGQAFEWTRVDDQHPIKTSYFLIDMGGVPGFSEDVSLEENTPILINRGLLIWGQHCSVEPSKGGPFLPEVPLYGPLWLPIHS